MDGYEPLSLTYRFELPHAPLSLKLVSASESALVDFFGVQSVACTFAREFDRKAPPSGDFSTLSLHTSSSTLRSRKHRHECQFSLIPSCGCSHRSGADTCRNRLDRVCANDQPALDSEFTLNRMEANHVHHLYLSNDSLAGC